MGRPEGWFCVLLMEAERWMGAIHQELSQIREMRTVREEMG
jgi:hypothetical protein